MSAGVDGGVGAASTTLPSSIANELRNFLGADAVITDPGTLLTYDSDGLVAYRVRPRAVLL
ncbi:MAG: FAD-binding oxidoreductase, partial [Longimicrobiales bacterium]